MMGVAVAGDGQTGAINYWTGDNSRVTARCVVVPMPLRSGRPKGVLPGVALPGDELPEVRGLFR